MISYNLFTHILHGYFTDSVALSNHETDWHKLILIKIFKRKHYK